MIEAVILKVDKLYFPADFIILDMEEDMKVPIILCRPFLATENTLIDVRQGKLTLHVQDDEVTFNMFKAVNYPMKNKECFHVDKLEEHTIVTSFTKEIRIDDVDCLKITEDKSSKNRV